MDTENKPKEEIVIKAGTTEISHGKLNHMKMTNKQFKALHKPTIFWNSKNQGTYNIGKNEFKRNKKKQRV